MNTTFENGDDKLGAGINLHCIHNFIDVCAEQGISYRCEIFVMLQSS